jgi:hypothetical protein
MGKVHAEIDERLRAFIEAQHVFFVATAPSGAAGHVNVSPKGLDTLRVIGPKRIAYLDYVGSGIETIAHLRENARIVVMFCAFDGPPKILRLHGRGSVFEPHDPEFSQLYSLFAPRVGARAVIAIDLERISDSCGFGVPLFEYRGPRSQLDDWARNKGDERLLDYQCKENAESIDGLPGLRWVTDPGK